MCRAAGLASRAEESLWLEGVRVLEELGVHEDRVQVGDNDGIGGDAVPMKLDLLQHRVGHAKRNDVGQAEHLRG